MTCSYCKRKITGKPKTHSLAPGAKFCCSSCANKYVRIRAGRPR